MVEKNQPSFYAKDTSTWRKWLQRNHAKEKSVWLIIYHKASATPSVVLADAVEEALCFGWIDSKPNKRDHESYYLFFAPRKQGSVWSKINKQRIEKLMQEGRMDASGLAKIEQAKRDGSWTKLDAIEELVMPAALDKAFKSNKTARKNFDQFPPGVRKGIYQWIESAKTEATLQKRVTETVTLAAQNIRANQWRK
jgi:uncharacterized protein YdeI (YjbR/CyaY-like superfamily)